MKTGHACLFLIGLSAVTLCASAQSDPQADKATRIAAHRQRILDIVGANRMVSMNSLGTSGTLGTHRGERPGGIGQGQGTPGQAGQSAQ